MSGRANFKRRAAWACPDFMRNDRALARFGSDFCNVANGQPARWPGAYFPTSTVVSHGR